MDVREELAAAFAAEPPHRSIDDRLSSGREALRRRRLLVGSAAVAVVVVTAGGYAVAGPRADSTGSNPAIATSPSAGSTPESSVEPSADPSRAVWARIFPDGGFAVNADVTEVRRINDPLPGLPRHHSVALELRKGQSVKWFLLAVRPGETWTSSTGAYVGFASLEEWVADQRSLQTGTPTQSYVEFADDGSLRPAAPGVELVRQQADPPLPDSYGGGLDTAVAEVVVDDVTYYVLARDPDKPDYIAVPAVIGGATLADFLDYAREQYSGGEGLR